MPRTKKAVTITDIAEKCGVSTASVSRVLSGKVSSVSDSLYNKIILEAHNSGYPLRTLPGQDPQKIIIACIESNDPEVYSRVTEGIAAIASSYHYSLLLWQFSELQLSQKEISEFYSALNPAGIILAVPTLASKLEEIARKYPLVQCMEYSSEKIPRVYLDEYQAAQTAIQYLISAGRKRIAVIQKSPELRISQTRIRGISDAMSEAGYPLDPNYLVTFKQGWSFDLFTNSIESLFLGRKRPDAVFASDDLCAATAIKAITGCGLKVPGDVSVIGMGNSALCDVFNPSITSLTYPLEQMGQMACELLFDRINHNIRSSVPVVFKSELILRSSA